jgi:hypothetical protein
MKPIFLALLVFSALSAQASEIDDGSPLPGEVIIPLGTDASTPVDRYQARQFRDTAPRPELLGQSGVSNRMAPVAVPLRSCRSPGSAIDSLRIRFLTSPVVVRDFEVVYGNKERETVRLRRRFEANSESDWIPINTSGARRCVNYVILKAQNANLTPYPATAQVFGLVRAIPGGRR